ncbi:MAG: hypothetical protein ACRDBG_08050, partial [Waterburya sp.]
MDNEIIYDTLQFPSNFTYTSKVLTVGSFHSDEVDKNDNQLAWVGLFKNQNGYYLSQTKIITRNVPDIDEDENTKIKTGWEVSTTNSDSCIILIESMPQLMSRKIQNIDLPQNQMYPGDTLAFTYLGIDYKLFATGGKKKTEDNSDYFDVWNYKLYLSAVIKGKVCKSLLVAQPTFDDAMISLIFAGDIDGDEILDLIIDTANHYN